MCAQSKTVTAEEAARVLHVSKRKCAWMLQNGHIPCIDTGKKTRRYTIRFHDLRHSCASTMLALGKQMKDIQMWLGHSDIGTTGNIYSHLDSHSKVQTAAAIYDALTDYF